MACVLHARHRGIFAGSIESVGKQARDEGGKHPVNEDDEEIYQLVNTGTAIARDKCCEILVTKRSTSLRAQPSNPGCRRGEILDCFAPNSQ